jgi:hypothetical protein
VPARIGIPVGRRCRAVYVLHAAGYLPAHIKVAAYRFVYEDGSSETFEVLGLGAAGRDARAMAQHERMSAIQDWWPTHRHFENSFARKVIVSREGNPCDCRYLYTLQWLNPRPSKALREVRLESVPGVGSVVLVLGITVLATA